MVGQHAVELNSLLSGSLESLAMPLRTAVPHRSRSIATAVREITEHLTPGSGDVELVSEVAPDASEVPVGPLEAVLCHGIRHAVEACLDRGSGGRVELSITVNTLAELVVLISDAGPGLRGDVPDPTPGRTLAHHLGLGLSREIVGQLGGRLLLSEGPSGRGLRLRIEVPVGRLR